MICVLCFVVVNVKKKGQLSMIPKARDFLIVERKFEILVHISTAESCNILPQDLVENTYYEGVKETQKRDTTLSIYSEFESIISRTMINRSCCNRCILLFLATVTVNCNTLILHNSIFL